MSWLPAYLQKLEELAPPFYRRWGEVLMRALLEEALRSEEQQELSAHLRMAPGLANPRASGQTLGEFLPSLLSPARSGMILTRADLGRAARRLSLAYRFGERRLVLESLIGQDAQRVFGWLASEAEAWTERHERLRPALGKISEAWASKSRAAATLFKELAQAAAAAEGPD